MLYLQAYAEAKKRTNLRSRAKAKNDRCVV